MEKSKSIRKGLSYYYIVVVISGLVLLSFFTVFPYYHEKLLEPPHSESLSGSMSLYATHGQFVYKSLDTIQLGQGSIVQVSFNCSNKDEGISIYWVNSNGDSYYDGQYFSGHEPATFHSMNHGVATYIIPKLNNWTTKVVFVGFDKLDYNISVISLGRTYSTNVNYTIDYTVHTTKVYHSNYYPEIVSGIAILGMIPIPFIFALIVIEERFTKPEAFYPLHKNNIEANSTNNSQEKIVCPDCLTPKSQNDVFCANCGHKF